MRIVDGLALSAPYRAALRPGEAVACRDGKVHVLPRFFFEITSWDEARSTRLAEHFTLAEVMAADCRECDLLRREFPRYVPCAVRVLARYLEEFRQRLGTTIHIAANGGYRSPAHARSRTASPHNWAVAADIYRVGSTLLDDRAGIEKYGALAAAIGPEVAVKPFGSGAGETDDHLHIDLGYLTAVPAECDEAGAE